MEEWRDISGYEGLYQVSNLGRVKSLGRIVDGVKRNKLPIKRIKVERILKQSLNPDGYAFIRLCKDSIMTTKYVHKLVAISFLGEMSGLHVDHINNVQKDNRLENLQWIFPRENTSKDRKGSSKFIGVSLRKNSKKWESYISINKRRKHLGLFNNEKDAKEAYQKALIENRIENKYAFV